MSLRELRVQKRLTQMQLASLSGLKQSTIANYETGERKPSLKNANKLASALNASLDEIYSSLNIS